MLINNYTISTDKTIKLLIICMLLLITILMYINQIYWISIILFYLLIIFFFSKNFYEFLISSILMSLLLLMLKFKIILFNFIPQAKILLDSNTDLLYWFERGHVHSIRLFIAYPGYLISKFLNVELNIGYSLYLILIFSLLLILLIRQININNKYYHFISFSIIFIIIFLSIIMNGRVILSFIGISLMLNSMKSLFFEGKLRNIYIIICIALPLTFVSSGTQFISMILFLVGLFLAIIYRKVNIRGKFILLLIILSPLLYLYIKFTFFMMNRNFEYFGDGIDSLYPMLNHGLGRMLNQNLGISLILLLVLLIIFIVFSKKIYRTYKNEIFEFYLILCVFLSLCGFLFGLSTGSLSIPIIIFTILFFRNREYI